MATVMQQKRGTTAPTGGDLAAGQIGLDTTNKRVYTSTNGTDIIETGVNPAAEIQANAGIALPDSQKATFGTGDDLQIYHNGSNSYIDDAGTGSLIIRAANNLELQKYTGETYLTAASDGAVEVYYDDAKKLATTSTGVTVTGVLSADQLNSNNGKIFLDDNGSHNGVINAPASLFINFDSDNTSASEKIVFGYDRDSTSGGTTVMELNSTGIDVTGTVTADGLTVDNNSSTPVFINRDQAVDGYAIVLNQANSTDGNSLEINYQTTTTGTVTPNTVMAGILFEAQTHDWSTRKGNIFLRTTEGGVGYKDRVKVAYNGDISFYEDTGTTAKFFWDASAESLGIGTTSPSSTYGIDSTKAIRVVGASPSFTMQESDASNQQWQLGSYAGDFAIRNITASTYPVTVDTSGNVGIGTSSPSHPLTIQASGTSGNSLKLLGDSTNDSARIMWRNNADDTETGRIAVDGSANLTFHTGSSGTERMRIDSSGNLLVGKTASNTSVVGCELLPSGIAALTANGNQAIYLNRTTSDGDIAEFRKDGTTVGSIGTLSGDLTVGTGITGIHFKDASDAIIPYNVSTGADRNGDIDLGLANNRFKNLYLSGGVYLGGTGSANYLDDYEEGTWTPVFEGGTTDPSGVTYDGATMGTYTKVGNLVTVVGRIRTDAITSVGSGELRIAGLPFSVSSTRYAAASFAIVNAFASNNPRTGYGNVGTDYIVVQYRSSVTGDDLTNQCSDLGTGGNDNSLSFTMSYVI